MLSGSGFPELLRRRRDRGRRLRLLSRAWGSFGFRLQRFLGYFHVMVAIVLGFGFVGLGGFGNRLTRSLGRGGGGLRGILGHDRQRHGKADQRSNDNST